jgi:hypothetical protein
MAAGTWNPDRDLRDLGYDRANALGLGGPDRAGRRIPGNAKHLMVDATTGRPEHLPAAARRHPHVDAGIRR